MRISVPFFATVVVVAIAAGALVPAAFTQAPQPAPSVYVIGFMKVDPEKVQEYLRVERDIWKPVHQERIRTGRMKSWMLYRVRFPYGTANEYDFVTVNEYPSFEDEQHPIAEVFAKVHPSVPFEQIIGRTFGARRNIRGEVWQRLEHLP